MASSSPLPLPLAAPLLSSVSCFVFGFGTGYCGSVLRLQKSHRFSGFGEWRTPYKGSTMSTKSKSVLNQLIFFGGPSLPYWYITTSVLFLSALATNIHLFSDPSPLRPVLRHRSSDGWSNPLGVLLLPAPAEP